MTIFQLTQRARAVSPSAAAELLVVAISVSEQQLTQSGADVGGQLECERLVLGEVVDTVEVERRGGDVGQLLGKVGQRGHGHDDQTSAETLRQQRLRQPAKPRPPQRDTGLRVYSMR